MGFFEQQDRARRATTRLLVLYAVAVTLIVAALECPMPPAIAALDPRLLRK